MFGRSTLTTLVTLGAFALFLFLFAHYSSYTFTAGTPLSSVYTQSFPDLSTDTWALFDSDTGELFQGNNQQDIRPIASVTKLMTAALVLEGGVAEKEVAIAFSDVATEGHAGKLTQGEVLTLRELLFPLLIESSNDAGEAISRALEQDFWMLIEQVSKNAGLRHTQIVDASGLSSGNISNAEDLARLFSYLRSTHPYILDITTLKLHIGRREGQGWVNNNPARSFESFKGGKHGYIPEAGRTFVGAFTPEGRDESVGIVLLGSKDLLGDLTLLLAYLEYNTQ